MPSLSTQSFRLLRLEPGGPSDPIYCQLEVHALDSKIEFIALSYTWGDQKKRHEIWCNGFKMTIATNLNDIMQQIRSPSKTIFLWADAICIDQSNIPERGMQVQWMGKIYHKASHVYVWLGRESTSSARAITFLQALCTASKLYEGDRMSYTDLMIAGIPSAEHGDWKILESLFWREWWTRMWIIQELCVSRRGTFICGSASIDAPDLFAAVEFIAHSAIASTTGIDTGSAIQFAKLHREHTGGYFASLLDLLIETRSFQASDYKDKIYALLGMCCSSDAHTITPNYDPAIPYSELYRSIAVSFLRQGSLRLFTAISDPYWRNTTFTSSWVPDWSMGSRTTAFLHPSDPISSSASGNSTSAVRFSMEGTTIFLEGTMVDTVVSTHKPYLFHSMQERHSRGGELLSILPNAWVKDRGAETLMRMGIRLLCWEKAALQAGPRKGADALTLFLKTITAGRISGSNLKDIYRSFCMVQMFIRPDCEMDTRMLKDSCIFSKAFHRASWGRTFFVTGDGSLGIGPYSMRAGDLVVILEGGQTPYILRRRKDHHILVGECYVHGIMHGEVFGDDVYLETFAIV